jgi:hypothetical protein
MLGASYVATQRTHPYFFMEGDTCGSAVLPRDFGREALLAFNAIDCESSIEEAQAYALMLGQLGLFAVAYGALRRYTTDRGGQPTRVSVVPGRSAPIGGVVVACLALGVPVGIHTEREVRRVENLRPLAAARPVAVEVCQSMGRWSQGIVTASKEEGTALHDASTLEAKRRAVVALVERVAGGTSRLNDDLAEARSRYGDVPGVPGFLEVIQESFQGSEDKLTALVARARRLPMDSEARFEREKDGIAKAVSNAGGEPPTLSVLKLGSREAAVALAFEREPSCGGMFA